MAFLATSAYAQNDEPFFPASAGTVLLYEDRDADGTVLSFTRDSIAEMTGDFTDGSAIVYSTLKSNDTVSVTTREFTIFRDGEVIEDMILSLEESVSMALELSMKSVDGADSPEADEAFREFLEKMTVSGECRGIPSDIHVGMTLPDYSIGIKVMFIKLKVAVKDRKVTGRENITVPAGTFDCYVIEENMSSSGMMMSQRTVQKSWYARGVGLVMRQTWEKKKLTCTTVLTSVTPGNGGME